MAAEAAKVWTVKDVVAWAADDFRTRGIESPRLDAEVLVGHVLGVTRTQILLDGARPLDAGELGRLRELVKRRRAREPIAYLRGEREFWGLSFRVDARVLIPRPDTETLVGEGLARTSHLSLHARVLDLCTGSGCVAIALAKERPTSTVIGADLSEGAVDVARDNALRLGAYNAAFRVGDLFAPVAGERFDLVTANPPYIPRGDVPGLDPDIREFEPHLALDGGDDGLDLVRAIVAAAPQHLAPAGVLALEIGDGEAAATAALLRESGFEDVRSTRDYGKIERVVSGRLAR